MTENAEQSRPEFVEPELVKHEEKLADVTLFNGYGDDATADGTF